MNWCEYQLNLLVAFLFDDLKYRDLKNNCYRNLTYDYLIFEDFAQTKNTFIVDLK